MPPHHGRRHKGVHNAPPPPCAFLATARKKKRQHENARLCCCCCCVRSPHRATEPRREPSRGNLRLPYLKAHRNISHSNGPERALGLNLCSSGGGGVVACDRRHFPLPSRQPRRYFVCVLLHGTPKPGFLHLARAIARPLSPSSWTTLARRRSASARRTTGTAPSRPGARPPS